MKRRWVIVGIASIALIGVSIVGRTEHKNRQLAKRAATYRIRAEHGDAESQWRLGAMYYYGRGVPKNLLRLYVGTANPPNKEMPRVSTPSLTCIMRGKDSLGTFRSSSLVPKSC